jgi:hypothetical protein
MRLRRVQFTVRRLLVAVAVVAAAISMFVKPYWDQRRWSSRGDYHLRQGNAFLTRADLVMTQNHDAYEKLLRRGKWHQSLAAKYFRAAAYGLTPPNEGLPPPAL